MIDGSEGQKANATRARARESQVGDQDALDDLDATQLDEVYKDALYEVQEEQAWA